MTPEQFTQLMALLKELLITSRTYTLTGAADWPVLAVACIGLVGLLVYIWGDLKTTITGNRTEQKKELEKEEAERKRQDDMIWAAMRTCQEDCCPRRNHIEPQQGG